MPKPKIADTRPIAVSLEKGKDYSWCSCGRSKTQPFCDGSHAGTEFQPIAFAAEKAGKSFLCQCKRTANPPFCDGSHKEITQVELDADQGLESVWYKVAGPDEMQTGEVRSVQAGAKNIALTYFHERYGALDNACPHQGGPLSEGSIECEGEDCWLRCPWHGWDFHPLSGESPTGFEDGVETYPVDVRDDGVYVMVKERRERTRTVSDLMVETMANWGLTHVFGMVGHSNLGLADAIREQEDAGRLNYIGIRHEGAAAFACSGFAKLSGNPAACLSIAGPGATNLLTGLWDAKVDRAPVLALTGQVNTQVFGPGAFQEIDLASAFQAVSRFSQTVLPGSRHAELMTLALKHAVVERDVAHLIFPDEVQVIPADEDAQASTPQGRLAADDISPSEVGIQQALRSIGVSNRPVIIVGYGARNAMQDVMALAERLHAPVLTTFKAKGQIADSHPLAAGVLGRSGTPIASWCMNEADLLLVFGASFSNHTGISPGKSIIQVDFDRMALGKFHAVDVPVWGEISVTARRLLSEIPSDLTLIDQRNDLQQRWKLWREEKQRRTLLDRGKGINAAWIFSVLSRECPDNAVIAVDVGNNTYSFGRYFECANQAILMSGYLGSIGFGFPAAMGAWAATQVFDEHRNRPVISISGDGGFGQYLAEFTTAVKYGMNITHILLNNHELGKISKEQRDGHWKVWQTSLHNPNFADYANNCGGLGIRVEAAEQIELALRKAIEYEGPALVEIITDAELT
jgi:thiamine pyrophosphate-dependent acetolactate synthase large subunit-like protein/nitrite reductase/ring-hydroxylating ferredoxin subunit/CDGSH-type Zn-finger protein